MATRAGRDLIVAAATGTGGVAAVVRASGATAFDALGRWGREGPVQPRRCVVPAVVRLPAGELPCVAACMPGPGSYTGEDTVEWIVPGHPDLVEMVVRAVLAAVPGARRARPGEFTLRAFETGRLTLEQAEGVAASIAARTDAELRAAGHLREGGLGRAVDAALERLADLLALVEAGIDFTDQEDVVAIGAGELRAGLAAVQAALRSLVDGTVPLERLAAAPMVVLSGAANAGKSALFNALLGHDRAVVAPVAGTTRDALVEPWRVSAASGVIEVLLVDAPGRLEAAAEIDRLGQVMRESVLERASLTLSCSPDGMGHEEGDAVIRVRTKSDLELGGAPAREILTSTRTGAGLQELARVVAERAALIGACAAGEAPALARRHRDLVTEAVAHLDAARAALEGDADHAAPTRPELVSAALHGAVESLGGIRGRLAPDDILGRIFGRFCVGK
jgi:tRNA modification GTPase